MRLAHLRLRLAAHSRALLVPLAATFLVVGAYFPGPSEPAEGFAFSAVLATAIAAWFTIVIDRAVPPQADAMLVVRSGGAPARLRAQRVVVAELAVAITAVLLVVPIVGGVFVPAASATDVAAGAAGLMSCSVFGGALGLVLGRPVRGGTAFAVVVLVLVGSAALVTIVPAVAGPAGVGREIVHVGQGQSAAGLAVAVAVTLAYAVAMSVTARRVAVWRG